MALGIKSHLVKFAPLVISAAMVVVGYLLLHPQEFGLCHVVNGYYRNCLWSGDIIDAIGDASFFFSPFLFLASALIIFAPKSLFESWWSLSKIYTPIALLLIAVTPSEVTSSMIYTYPYRLYVAILLGSLYILISLILMGWKSYTLRKKV